jgi:hypothetical protein
VYQDRVLCLAFMGTVMGAVDFLDQPFKEDLESAALAEVAVTRKGSVWQAPVLSFCGSKSRQQAAS